MSLSRGSWHLTHAAAAKAGDAVPAIPTAISGTATAAEFAKHPNATAVAALIEAKNAAAAKKAAPKVQPARVKRGAPIKGKLGKAEPLRSAGVVIGTLSTNQPDTVPDGGPLGHLCQCLAGLAEFTITHGAECPAAPPRAADAAPPSLF